MSHLTTEQRCEISVYLRMGHSQKFIAEKIGKHKSVISRELKRNSDPETRQYNPKIAHEKYRKRMHEKPKQVKFTPEIQQIVNMGLEMDFSPEQIVGRSKLQGVEGMVSHERIYQYVWEDKRNGGDWHKHLRRKGRRYRKRGNKRDNRGIIRDRVSIDQRPAVVEDKKRFGDLEVDLVVGRNHKGALLTVNDRAGYLSWIAKLSGKHAQEIRDKAIQMLLPFKGMLHTITSDNGKEFAEHKAIAEALVVDYYFAHPYHSWERGANENMNGLIRQYLPKGTSFENLTDDDILLIQNKLNNRPRKKLGYLTPREYFFSNFAPVNLNLII